MRTMIDKFGRIVVPKEMRQRAGLHPGTEIEINEQGRDIVIKHSEHEPLLRDEDGVLVYTGKAAGDIISAVRKQREERLLKIGS